MVGDWSWLYSTYMSDKLLQPLTQTYYTCESTRLNWVRLHFQSESIQHMTWVSMSRLNIWLKLLIHIVNRLDSWLIQLWYCLIRFDSWLIQLSYCLIRFDSWLKEKWLILESIHDSTLSRIQPCCMHLRLIQQRAAPETSSLIYWNIPKPQVLS